jgi:tRNA modification GTPase
VLAGPVNAGKSTLFNALLGETRAIVSAEAGTTRDVLVAPARLGAYPVLVHDSAGERHLPDVRGAAIELERAGQELARGARATGELVLWLEPADGVGGPAAVEPPAGALRIVTKADLAPAPAGAVALAAGPEPAAAAARVALLFHARFALPRDPWRPGAACPFLAAQRAALARLAEPGLTPAARGELCATLLEPRGEEELRSRPRCG